MYWSRVVARLSLEQYAAKLEPTSFVWAAGRFGVRYLEGKRVGRGVSDPPILLPSLGNAGPRGPLGGCLDVCM